MKQYTSRELSEKLVKLGCKSQSTFSWFYPLYGKGCVLYENTYAEDAFREGDEIIPAFEFEDFCGTHEQARENRKLIWGAHLLTYTYQASDEIKIQISKKSFEHEAELMIRSNDWLKYLEKVMEERAA